MAEFLMKDFLKKRGETDFFVASCATSREELGNGVHYGTRQILSRLGISCNEKRAVQLTASDYDAYDYFVCMDENNRRNALRIFGSDPAKKISLLMDYTPTPRDVADPWYTGNFEQTYKDITAGIDGLYLHVKSR